MSPVPTDGSPLRVVVIGPECTGKTTMAAVLGARYEAPWVPEFARTFVDRVQRGVRLEDVDAIARGQRAAEDEALAKASAPLVVFDTDLVSTWVYSQHYFGDCPSWVEPAARARLGNLYLLLGIDVPWLPEDHQREQPERREELYRLFERTLERFGARVAPIRGPWGHRGAAAEAAVDRLVRRT